MGSIIAEAQNLIAQGVREITLIGQDTTCYGEDLGLKEGLAQLLDALAPLPGLRWLRFLYTYPNKVTTRLLETMARARHRSQIPRRTPYSTPAPTVLKTMKRGGNAPHLPRPHRQKARRIVPGIVIRTSASSSVSPAKPRPTSKSSAPSSTAAKDRLAGRLHLLRRRRREGLRSRLRPPRFPQRTIQARRRKLMRFQQKISDEIQARNG